MNAVCPRQLVFSGACHLASMNQGHAFGVVGIYPLVLARTYAIIIHIRYRIDRLGR